MSSYEELKRRVAMLKQVDREETMARKAVAAQENAEVARAKATMFAKEKENDERLHAAKKALHAATERSQAMRKQYESEVKRLQQKLDVTTGKLAASEEKASRESVAAETRTTAEDASSSSTASTPSAMSAWGSIGSFFTAALKTVTSLTSPEARAKQAEAERAAAKAQLLAAVVSTNIGRDCDLNQLRTVESAVLQLEAVNPTPTPMKSSLTKGRWSAVFTTSRQLLGLDKKISLTRQSGPIYWAFDTEEKRAEVTYTWPVKVERAALAVTGEGAGAELTFEQTKVFGLFSIGGGKQREYADLELTYLDLDLMVARGAGNTLYVLVQTNSAYRIGDTTSNNVNKRLN